MLFPQNLLRKVRSGPIALSELEEPIRAELFSGERWSSMPRAWPRPEVTPTPRKGRRLLPRVLENGRVLLEAYRAIAKAIREERTIIPAAEWLVDNFHIVDEQLREIRDDLPPGYYRELPKLAGGPSRAIRAFSGWPGRSSPIRTAALTRRRSGGSCAPTSACSR